MRNCDPNIHSLAPEKTREINLIIRSQRLAEHHSPMSRREHVVTNIANEWPSIRYGSAVVEIEDTHAGKKTCGHRQSIQKQPESNSFS